MNWAFAMFPEVQEPRQTGVGRCGDLAVHAESEDRLCSWRPSFRQPEPASVSGSLQAVSCVAIPDKGHVRAPFIGRPVVLEIDQEILPVAGEPVLFKVCQRKREGVVDADDGWRLAPKLVAQPFS